MIERKIPIFRDKIPIITRKRPKLLSTKRPYPVRIQPENIKISAISICFKKEKCLIVNIL